MALADLAGRRVLVLNAGSSSLKASLIEPPGQTLGRSETSWGVDASRADDREAGVRAALEALGIAEASTPTIDAVGHRVVHGGARFTRPTVVDADVIEGIEAVADLAPLHNRVALDTIRAARRTLPDIPHVACFDTAFHSTLPRAAFRYPLPERWYEAWGIRRYGFHGLSVEWSSRRAAALLGRLDRPRLVVAHLGSGCSVTAVDGGRSVDTSMGMTPLEGLMMGTRSGSIDPGVPFRLVRGGEATPEAILDDLEHASGLLGVSGRTSDMRELERAAADGDERATLAIDMFVRRAAAGIAAVATSLDRLDALVFTGGIGEHAGAVRRRIVERLGAIGVPALPSSTVEPAGDTLLSPSDAAVAVLRIEAREDLVIAAGTAEALETG